MNQMLHVRAAQRSYLNDVSLVVVLVQVESGAGIVAESHSSHTDLVVPDLQVLQDPHEELLHVHKAVSTDTTGHVDGEHQVHATGTFYNADTEKCGHW